MNAQHTFKERILNGVATGVGIGFGIAAGMTGILLRLAIYFLVFFLAMHGVVHNFGIHPILAGMIVAIFIHWIPFGWFITIGFAIYTLF